MKALLILLLGSIVLAGCASTSNMSEDDRALWNDAPEGVGAPGQ